MKYIHLEWWVDENMRDIVTNSLNEEWEVTFYLNSHGWNSKYAHQIVDLINSNLERVTLIATCEIASAAFRIFFFSKCKRKVLDDTEWLAHMARMDIRMDWNKEIWSVEKWRVKEMKKYELIQEKCLRSLGVSKRNRKLFLKWYDVYFNTKKLRKMLAKSI